ncbi:ArgS-related anticodon-binding protein NrtL [Streptomyces sp. H27-D2]|uniref:ArgS-related anticodon-binding protein NrtL n=1 Tax=Streptomyces sp. H27-D2 TaxID=3046304 RepID=UPI002DBA2C2C|nr:DALR anticodon-binding domain-containing protein [Streptomyces sp. H27-D2]MEC4016743.1 DALR anticodon-binding domain-containing protein [Streptomyces sp. H27-D2]
MTPAELSRTVLHTVRRAVETDELRVPVPARVTVRTPPRPGCGDYATNIALELAAAAGRQPRQVAEILRRGLAREPGIARVEIAAPGFLNITLDGGGHSDLVRTILAEGTAYGALDESADGPADGPAYGAYEQQAAPAPHNHAPPTPDDDSLRRLGPDAARWALLGPPYPDPELLLVQRESNPLFRVQYAYARTSALLRNARDLGLERTPEQDAGTAGHADPGTTAYDDPGERVLLGLLADFPGVARAAARHRAPERVARHLETTAEALQRTLAGCPPLPYGDQKPSAVHRARLALAEATGTVLANGLHQLGITAPAHL